MIFRLLLILLSVAKVYGQSYQAPAFLGMGNTAAGHQGIYSLWSNPAGTAGVEHLAVGAVYQIHFIPSDIRSIATFGALPLGAYGTLGLQHQDFGSTQTYRNFSAGVTWANRFGKHWRAAVGMRYMRGIWHTAIRALYAPDELPSREQVLFDVGVQYQWENLTLGGFYKQVGEVALGFSYLFSEQVYLATDLFLPRSERVDLRSGLEYRLHKTYRIRGGMATQPVQYYLGGGIHFTHLQIDVASAIHRELGLSPQLGVSYVF